MSVMTAPLLSVVVPTFNNVEVLGRCLDGWEKFAGGADVEVIVVEDGCRDSTPDMLEKRVAAGWGREHLRWVHESNVHELRATNRGFREARARIVMTWQDDMFLQVDWLVPELIATFAACADVGLLSLSRGLDCYPVDEPIERWEDLVDWRRLRSTIGPRPLNWVRLQEVDSVIRPWAVRRACLDAVGPLDEAFIPTEWDEADLAFRIRRAGWKIATHGYERDGAYFHLGSTTIGAALSDAYKQMVLRNGTLFHQRWDSVVQRDANRARKTWWRRMSLAAWSAAVRQAGGRSRRTDRSPSPRNS
jgi:GT2 family glycosyltransferase